MVIKKPATAISESRLGCIYICVVARDMAATESFRDVSLGVGRPPWPGSPISSCWTATYSIPRSDTRLEGGLILCHVERRLVLLDREGIAVDVRQADPAISIEAGTSIDFPFYHTEVGDIWASPIAPSRLGWSPLRPRRALGPRRFFRWIWFWPAPIPGWVRMVWIVLPISLSTPFLQWRPRVHH
jgi:hypothetical protein